MSEAIVVKYRVGQEDMPVKGAFASGDDAADADMEQEIIERVNRGDPFAWCWAKVTATCGPFEGFECVGGISCKNRKELKELFLKDMKQQAIHHLKQVMEDAHSAVLAAVEREREANRLLMKFDELKVTEEDET